MARIRTIKPEFWQDETIGDLSPNARLLFLASLNLADDEGLLKWNAAFLRAQVFMYDDLTIGDMGGLMQELQDSGIVLTYKDAKQQVYGWVINFRKHQKIDRPQKAKHPLPSLQNKSVAQAYYRRDGGVCHICEKEIDFPGGPDQTKSECLSLDHIKPQSKGGDHSPSNIKIAHFGCNASKRDKFDEDSTNPQEQLTAGKEQGTGNREQGIQQLQQHANRFSENVQPYQQQPEMSDDWNPDETTVRRIAMTSIPEDFIRNCIPEFRAYWLTAGRLPHGGNFQTAFLKSVQKAWAKHLNDTNQRGNGHAGSQLSSREAELRKANESTDWADGIGSGFPGAHTSGHSADQLALDSGHSDIPEVARVIPGPGRH
tara:strand:- start:1628 stop:2740 length:1113 start_codon:yes stop_codon:yes gene_type:complete